MLSLKRAVAFAVALTLVAAAPGVQPYQLLAANSQGPKKSASSSKPAVPPSPLSSAQSPLSPALPISDQFAPSADSLQSTAEPLNAAVPQSEYVPLEAAVSGEAASEEEGGLFNGVIRHSLRNRILTAAAALGVMGYGAYSALHLPVDVLPDLDRPRVSIVTEAPSLATEEVEAQVTVPLENAINGASGLRALRSSSGQGLSVVHAEFDWGTDGRANRQAVAERLATASANLPAEARPQMAPPSSVLGQTQHIGLWSEGAVTDPMELRALADWTIRPRLLSVPGVAQVTVMGGERKQYQVLLDPRALAAHEVTVEQVERALRSSNANASGGIINAGPTELIVRSLGRVQTLEDLEKVVVKADEARPVLLGQVARVALGGQVKRGDAAVNGEPAVILVVSKQPGADTRRLTAAVDKAVAELAASLPKDVRVDPGLYRQRDFIDRSMENVTHALLHGAALVALVLLIFLRNARTTAVTLTALPLSLASAAAALRWLGSSINTMTLGGLAVAIGELVDDAVVDVENVFRRLRENRHSPEPKSALRVVYEASLEVRGSIVYSTVLVMLGFLPLLAMDGLEGRLFKPLAVAYLVSILASLAVSLTVTPVLSYWSLGKAEFLDTWKDGFFIGGIKRLTAATIRTGVRFPRAVAFAAAAAAALSLGGALRLDRDFLPPFNEGTAQVNVVLPPGASLAASNHVASQVDQRLKGVQGVTVFGRRTGRAEQDEHAEGVNVSEIIVTFDAKRPREEALADIRAELAKVPGAVVSVEQPMAHLVSHLMFGVKAQVGIKIHGDDLATLRRAAEEVRAAVAGAPGVADLMLEPQIEVPQLQVRVDRDRLAAFGLEAGAVNALVETALRGSVVSEVAQGARRSELLVRLDEPYRGDLDAVRRLTLELPGGGKALLSDVAEIREDSGPNAVNREGGRRRALVQFNVSGRALGETINEVKERVAKVQAGLPSGYSLEFGGRYESALSASRLLALLSAGSLGLMFLALYSKFRSANMALQVLASLPLAAIGGVAALYLSGQSLSVAALVGFISLAGIASRNGILLISHYLRLMKEDGGEADEALLVRAGQERVVPMLMTALSAGIALVPLLLQPGAPGKEILYPVSTVLFGGLLSATILDILVHPALFQLLGRKSAARLLAGPAEDGLSPRGPRHARRAGKLKLRFLAAMILFFILPAGLAVSFKDRWLPAARELITRVIPAHDHDHDAEEAHEHGHAGHGHAHGEEHAEVEISLDARKSAGITSGPVEPGVFERFIAVPAVVVEVPGRTHAEIPAPLEGVMTEVLAKEGQSVEPGATLFKLRLTEEGLLHDQRELLQEVLQLDAVLVNLKRIAPLADSGVVPHVRLVELQNRQRELEAEINAHRKALRMRGLTEEQVDGIVRDRELVESFAVKAPAGEGSAVLSRLKVRPGQQVKAGEGLATASDYSELRIEGRAFGGDLEALSEAARQGWTLSAQGAERGSTLKAEGLKVSSIAPETDPATRALPFYVPLKNEAVSGEGPVSWRFKPGQRLELRVPVERLEGQLVVPAGAVVKDGAENFIYIRHINHFDRRSVQVLRRGPDSVVLAPGSIKPGEKVVLANAYQVHLALKAQTAPADPHAGHHH